MTVIHDEINYNSEEDIANNMEPLENNYGSGKGFYSENTKIETLDA